MKTRRAIPVLIVLAASAALAAPHGDWFDLEGCTVCRNLTLEQGLLDAMDWENHLLSDGMLSVTQVPEAYAGSFERAMARMEAAGASLSEHDPLCGSCRSFGALMAAGARIDNVKTGAGHITVVTGRDPEVVAEIRAHAETTMRAYRELLAGGRSGHGHR